MSQNQPQPQPPSSPKPPGNLKKPQMQQLKAQTIKFLRGTIGVLEGVVVKLETTPTVATSPSLNNQNWWNAALSKIRSLLPDNISSNLSNTALTGIIAGVAVIFIWTTSALLPGKPQLPEVTSVPASEPVPAPTITAPPELAAPAAPEPIEVTPSPPEASPAPPPMELTPEQNLIASIENQVAEISNRYADGLIQSIQANFQGSRLTVKVGYDWYNFKQSQQDNLATQMLKRSKELDFSQLEITDPQGTLLARSPVVGTDMVILKRQA